MRFWIFLCVLGFGTRLCAQNVSASPCLQKTEAAVFRVGLAQVDITPKKVVTMGGYGTYYLFPALTRHNDIGVHDPLFASTLWIEDDAEKPLAIVSLDLAGLSSVFVQKVRDEAFRRLKRPGLQLILTATHTHQAPDVLGLWGAIPNSGQDPAYMSFLESQILTSVENAAQNSRCASLSWVETQKATSWHDSLKDPDRLEKVMSLIVHDGNAVLGSLTQWGAHPTILHAGNNTISSDFPGAFRYYMGQRLPGIHIYVNGMLGASYVPEGKDQSFPDPFVKGDRDPDSLMLHERVAYQGHDLAQRVLTAIDGPRHPIRQKSLLVQTKHFDIPLDNFLFRLAETLGMLEFRDLNSGKMHTEITRARIGELQILTLPGEMFPEGTRQILDGAGSGGPIMLLGIANDWVGYLLTGEENHELKHVYHRKLSPHPDAAARIVDAYLALFKERDAGGPVPPQDQTLPQVEPARKVN